MATRQSTVDYLLDQLSRAGGVSAKKMFGEYCLYLDAKPVGLVCDDQLFLKPTSAGRELIAEVTEGSPFPGAKPHFLIPIDDWSDREAMARLVIATYEALPAPKPKKRKS